MPTEQTDKLVFRLSRQEVEALADFVGPQGRGRWWYREWMHRRGHELDAVRRRKRRKKSHGATLVPEGREQ